MYGCMYACICVGMVGYSMCVSEIEREREREREREKEREP